MDLKKRKAFRIRLNKTLPVPLSVIMTVLVIFSGFVMSFEVVPGKAEQYLHEDHHPGIPSFRDSSGNGKKAWSLLAGIGQSRIKSNRLLTKRQAPAAVIALDDDIRSPNSPAILDPGDTKQIQASSGGPRREPFIQDRPVNDRPLFVVVNTSTQRSFGLRVQKATERTSTTVAPVKRTRPPPRYPDRNSVREFHPPSTVSGQGVGSVQVIRTYGNPSSQRSSSSTLSPASSVKSLIPLTAALILSLILPYHYSHIL